MGGPRSIQELRGKSTEFSKRWDLQVSLERLESIISIERRKGTPSLLSLTPHAPPTHINSMGLAIALDLKMNRITGI